MGKNSKPSEGEILDAQVRDRLKSLRGDRTQAEFGALLGMSRGAYASLESCGKTISFQALSALADFPGVSLYWLFTGVNRESYQSGNSDNPMVIHEVPGPQERSAMIPIVGAVSAGHPTVLYPDIQESPEYLRIEDLSRGQYSSNSRIVALHVAGESMEPQFQNHDLIIVECGIPPARVRPNSFVIAADDDDELTFKRFHPHGDIILLEPLNARYSTIPVNRETIRIYGVCIALYRQMK